MPPGRFPQLRPARAVYSLLPRHQTAVVIPRLLLPLLVVSAMVAATGCERVKDEFFGASAAETRYEADTLLLKSEPPLLFRIVPTSNGGARAYAVAAGSANGVAMLRLSDRAWREFDAAFFRSGKILPLVREGRSDGELRLVRGMWDPPSQPLDDFPGCAIVIPAAVGIYPEGKSGEVAIARGGTMGTPKERANLEQALQNIATLVGPAQGITVSDLATYRRRAFIVPNMANQAESVVAIYDDPAVIPPEERKRPRQLVVILDRSAFGYRPSFTFATKAGPKDEPAWRLLDWGDLTGDGTPEIIFGIDMPGANLSTIVVGYSAGEWRELMRRGEGRCDF